MPECFMLLRRPGEQQINLYSENAAGDCVLNFTPFSTNVYQLRCDEKIWDGRLPKTLLKAYSESETTPQEHITKIINAVQELEVDQKVVLARTHFSPNEIDLLASYEALSNAFPNSFVYVFFHTEFGLWMGASPELLGKFKDDKFETVALAGTKTKATAWSKKEYKEHEFVVQDLMGKIPNAQKSETFTVSYGEIQHLKTKIHTKTDYKNASNAVKKLHPTPAICGTPTHWAQEYILEKEGFDRSLYTGYFGIEKPNHTDLKYFVNLRCLQVFSNGILCYAGGGITQQSNAEQEWKETENKICSFARHLNYK